MKKKHKNIFVISEELNIKEYKSWRLQNYFLDEMFSKMKEKVLEEGLIKKNVHIELNINVVSKEPN